MSMNLSRDAKRARHFFNFLSLGCDLFSFYFAWQYKKAAAAIGRIVDLSDKRVLDIGTGTGVWASFLQEKGSVVHGIDIAEKILHRAERRCRGRATFHVDDAENLTHCEDQSYDIATASFVLHGVRKEGRDRILREMKRVSREAVIVLDYGSKWSLPTFLIEWIEGSDYRSFLNCFEREYRNVFADAKRIPVKKESVLYIGYLKQSATEGIQKRPLIQDP